MELVDANAADAPLMLPGIDLTPYSVNLGQVINVGVRAAGSIVVNGTISAVCLFLTPTVMESGNVLLLFLVVGVAYWQYGGGLSLLPAMTADFFGSKNLGLNYGLVFLGWGIAFCVPQIAGYLKDVTGSLAYAFYLSGALLVAGVVLSRLIRRPLAPGEKVAGGDGGRDRSLAGRAVPDS